MRSVVVVGRAVAAPLDFGASVMRKTAQVGTSTLGWAWRGISTRTTHFQRWSSGWGFLANTRFDYASEVSRTARQNTAVLAVVGWMCRNFPEAPVRIARLPRNETDDVTYISPGVAGAGALLSLLERPNPWYSGVLQWMATLADWCCTGNAYWLKIRNQSGRVVQLWWLPSWLVEPRWDLTRDDQFIGWYDYALDSQIWSYYPEDIVHFRDGIDPMNNRKGLSRLAALYREIFTDDEASNMTASLMRNLGIPGVVISPANTTGPMGRIQDPEQVKETFMEKFAGDKRGEPMVMSVPTEVKVLSWSPQQMSLRELRKIPEERVSAVYGVAAIVAGLGAGLERSTFSNFGEARKAAYQEAIIPAQRLFAAELEVQLLPEFAEPAGLDMFFDWKQASAMHENTADVWKRYMDASTKGLLTRAAFKRAVGEPVQDEDDVYILPNNFFLLRPGEKPPERAPSAPDGPPRRTASLMPGYEALLPAHAGDNGYTAPDNGHIVEAAT